MKTVATPPFLENVVKGIGLKVDHASEAVLHADRKEVLTLQGKTIHYFMRKVPESRSGAHILVYGVVQGDTMHMNNAFRVYPDLHPDFQNLRPTEVLEAVCQRFGYEQILGTGEKTKFVLSRTIRFPIPPGNNPDEPLGNIITCPSMGKRDVNIEMLVNRRRDGDAWLIDIALAFVLNVAAYRDWMRCH